MACANRKDNENPSCSQYAFGQEEEMFDLLPAQKGQGKYHDMMCSLLKCTYLCITPLIKIYYKTIDGLRKSQIAMHFDPHPARGKRQPIIQKLSKDHHEFLDMCAAMCKDFIDLKLSKDSFFCYLVNGPTTNKTLSKNKEKQMKKHMRKEKLRNRHRCTSNDEDTKKTPAGASSEQDTTERDPSPDGLTSFDTLEEKQQIAIAIYKWSARARTMLLAYECLASNRTTMEGIIKYVDPNKATRIAAFFKNKECDRWIKVINDCMKTLAVDDYITFMYKHLDDIMIKVESTTKTGKKPCRCTYCGVKTNSILTSGRRLEEAGFTAPTDALNPLISTLAAKVAASSPSTTTTTISSSVKEDGIVRTETTTTTTNVTHHHSNEKEEMVVIQSRVSYKSEDKPSSSSSSKSKEKIFKTHLEDLLNRVDHDHRSRGMSPRYTLITCKVKEENDKNNEDGSGDANVAQPDTTTDPQTSPGNRTIKKAKRFLESKERKAHSGDGDTAANANLPLGPELVESALTGKNVYDALDNPETFLAFKTMVTKNFKDYFAWVQDKGTQTDLEWNESDYFEVNETDALVEPPMDEEWMRCGVNVKVRRPLNVTTRIL